MSKLQTSVWIPRTTRPLAKRSRTACRALSKAQGYQAHSILAGIESPGRYLLTVHWNTLEDHTQGFRESPAFAEWRAIIGPFFAQPPQVEHFTLLP